MSAFDLEGKVGIVTGGGSAIGLAIAETLAAAGARAVVFDVDHATASESVALALAVDVSEEAAVADAFGVADERFGRLDFLVNNAGIDIETVPSPEWLADPFDRTIEVDVKGVYHCMRHAIARMRRQQSGSIVNIGTEGRSPSRGRPVLPVVKLLPEPSVLGFITT
jgi:NAD(P)-dependent dehydrogenase (short-subunit alcohol dehydrogenase family)